MSDEYVVTAASIFKNPPILEENFAVLLGATRDRVATDIGKMRQDPNYAGRAPPCMSDEKSNHFIINTLDTYLKISTTISNIQGVRSSSRLDKNQTNINSSKIPN